MTRRLNKKQPKFYSKFLLNSHIIKLAPKVNRYLGFLCSKICRQEISKIAQSGHTGYYPYEGVPRRPYAQIKTFFSTWLLQQRKGKSDKTDLKRDYKFFEHLLSDRFRHQNTFASFFSFLPSFLPSLHYTLLSLQFYRKNFSWCKNGCRHSSVDSSAPTILLPWVQVPSTPFTLFHL